MALMIEEVYDAFRAANVSEEQARAAATAVAGYESRLHRMEQRLTVLTWMVGTLVPVLIALVGGLYVVLFNVLARLPR